jgi:hypothetical protein
VKLTALTLVKIDGDVIEEFVRHTLKFVDHLIVVDNASLDLTPVILTALVAEGLPVTIWHDEIVAENPNITTELARKAFAESSTDYLLILDADEFIKVSSRRELESALSALPAGAHASFAWTTYVPTKSDDPREPRTLARLQHRRVFESNPYTKLVISSSFRDQPHATIIYGNHDVEDPAGTAIVTPLSGVQLAHFPVRSLSQIQCKVLLGWSMFLAMGYDEEGALAYQWRRLYDRLRLNPVWSADDFWRYAWSYLDEGEQDMPEVVYDPLPHVICRYESEAPDVLRTAIKYTRQLAKAYARLSRSST